MAKATKLRPYKVDYIDISEVQGDRAPVHFRLVRVPTAVEAKDFVRRMSIPPHARIILSARRFYKKLPKENPVPVAMEKLFRNVRATEIIEQIEAYQNSLIASAPPVATGPLSPATQAVLSDLAGMDAHDQHEQLMSTFVPTEPPPANFPSENPPATAVSAIESELNRDRTLSMMEYSSIASGGSPDTPAQICPNCGQGQDTNGDGDCLICTSEAYKQMHAAEKVEEAATRGRWLFSAFVVGTILLLTALYVCQQLFH